MKKSSLIMSLVGVAVMAVSSVAVQAASDCSNCPASGALTRQWVELQRSGAQASVHADGTSSDVVEHIYQRYVDSFTHKIPDTYSRDGEGLDFGSSGGGS